MKAPIGAMSSLEFLSTATAIAGLVFIFSGMYTATQHPSMFAVVNENEMNCPDIRVRHFVSGDLKTGVQRVDACSKHLNVKVQ
jgi:hypothetical protein